MAKIPRIGHDHQAPTSGITKILRERKKTKNFGKTKILANMDILEKKKFGQKRHFGKTETLVKHELWQS